MTALLVAVALMFPSVSSPLGFGTWAPSTGWTIGTVVGKISSISTWWLLLSISTTDGDGKTGMGDWMARGVGGLVEALEDVLLLDAGRGVSAGPAVMAFRRCLAGPEGPDFDPSDDSIGDGATVSCGVPSSIGKWICPCGPAI